MANFSLDTRAARRLFREMPVAFERGAKEALTDIKNDWVREARNIAPIAPKGGGNLRRQINGDLKGSGMGRYVELEANATQDGRFNYAYYIHEMDAGGKNLTYSGAEKKFLDKSAEDRQAEWQQWFEEEIEKEVRRII